MRWGWLNRDANLFTRLLSLHLDAHFAVEQPARHRGGLLFGFNGTAGVWRRACIDAAGGWSADSLTEDLDLGFRAGLRGWQVRNLEEVAVPSEVPAQIGAVRTQQFRWMKGGAQVARKLLGTVWRSDEPLRRKLQGTAHLGGGSVFLAVMAILMLAPLLGRIALTEGPAYGAALGIASVPLQLTAVVLMAAYGTACIKRSGWLRGVVRTAVLFPPFLAFSAAMAPHNAWAVVDGWSGRVSPFVRPPKVGDRSTVRAKAAVPPMVWFELALGLWLGLGSAWQFGGGQLYGGLILGLHAVGFVGLAGASLGAAVVPAGRLSWATAAVAAGLALVGAEVGLRTTGAEVWSDPEPRFEFEPEAVEPDEVYGWRLKPGAYSAAHRDGPTIGVRHDAMGCRGGAAGEAAAVTVGLRGGGARSRVEVHGGSFVYGLGLAEAETLPARLGAALPEWSVKNRGVPGYGPVQAWLALERHVAEGTAPDVMIVGYASFHDERTTLVRNWRRALRGWDLGATPSTRTRRGTPEVAPRAPTMSPWEANRRSVLVHRIERAADFGQDLVVDSQAVTANLLTQLHRAGAEHGVRVVVAGLADDRWTRKTLWRLDRRGVETVDVGLPWTDARWHLPHDPTHPNADATARWADQLADQPWARKR